MNKANGSEASCVNWSELLARVDNDRELLCDLLSIFKREFPEHLQALRNAVAANDSALKAGSKFPPDKTTTTFRASGNSFA